MTGSDDVAAERLRRPTGGLDPTSLVFDHRVRWHVVFGLGSWAFVICVPMLILILSGDIPTPRQAVAVVPVFTIGIALAYFAVREVRNGTRLWIEGRTLRLRRGPHWPFRAREWSLDGVTGAHIELHPISFRFPAKYRSFVLPRPYRVHLDRATADTPLPLALGRRDAQEVASWVGRASRGGAPVAAPGSGATTGARAG